MQQASQASGQENSQLSHQESQGPKSSSSLAPRFCQLSFVSVIVSTVQENSDSSELPSSGESLVTVSAAAVVPPSPAPPPAKKFFKKSRIVEEDTKEDVVEGDGEDAPPSSRQRPRRPTQRTERWS